MAPKVVGAGPTMWPCKLADPSALNAAPMRLGTWVFGAFGRGKGTRARVFLCDVERLPIDVCMRAGMHRVRLTRYRACSSIG